jgi:hypothetical protein
VYFTQEAEKLSTRAEIGSTSKTAHKESLVFSKGDHSLKRAWISVHKRGSEYTRKKLVTNLSFDG